MQSGIPMLYSGDEIAQLNDYTYRDNPAKADDSRYLHRGKLQWDLAARKEDLSTPEGQIFCGLKALGSLRASSPAFTSDADVWTLDTGDNGLLAIGRYAQGEKVIGIFNFTGEDKTLTLSFDPGTFTNMLTGERRTLQNLPIPAYGFYYMQQLFER